MSTCMHAVHLGCPDVRLCCAPPVNVQVSESDGSGGVFGGLLALVDPSLPPQEQQR